MVLLHPHQGDNSADRPTTASSVSSTIKRLQQRLNYAASAHTSRSKSPKKVLTIFDTSPINSNPTSPLSLQAPPFEIPKHHHHQDSPSINEYQTKQETNTVVQEKEEEEESENEAIASNISDLTTDIVTSTDDTKPALRLISSGSGIVIDGDTVTDTFRPIDSQQSPSTIINTDVVESSISNNNNNTVSISPNTLTHQNKLRDTIMNNSTNSYYPHINRNQRSLSSTSKARSLNYNYGATIVGNESEPMLTETATNISNVALFGINFGNNEEGELTLSEETGIPDLFEDAGLLESGLSIGGGSGVAKRKRRAGRSMKKYGFIGLFLFLILLIILINLFAF